VTVVMNNSRTKHSSSTSVDFGKVPSAKLPTQLGDFIIYGFQDPETGEEAVALAERVGNPVARFGGQQQIAHKSCCEDRQT